MIIFQVPFRQQTVNPGLLAYGAVALPMCCWSRSCATEKKNLDLVDASLVYVFSLSAIGVIMVILICALR